MRNLGIFVIGLIIGPVLMSIYSFYQEKDHLETYPLQESQKVSETEVSFKSVNQDNMQSEALLNQITSLKAELAKEKNIPTINTPAVEPESDSDAELSLGPISEEEFNAAVKELMRRRELLTAEQERLGTQAFEDLKRNQPIELSDLFNANSKLSNNMLKSRISKYKKHLAQEKDASWAYEAEGFLRNYFAYQQNPTFTALRIDCRTNSCEVAGLFNFENEEDVLTLERLSMSSRFKSFIKVRQDIEQQAQYGEYFASGVRNISFSPDALAVNPMPHAFFLNRIK